MNDLKIVAIFRSHDQLDIVLWCLHLAITWIDAISWPEFHGVSISWSLGKIPSDGPSSMVSQFHDHLGRCLCTVLWCLHLMITWVDAFSWMQIYRYVVSIL
jgi:hypothetical protein